MASSDTAALVVALSAQLTKFEKDMDSAYGIADKGVRRIEDRFSKLNPGTQFADALESKLTRLASAAGLVELVAKMAELNEQTAKIGESAATVGLSTDRFQQFRFAVVQAGGSIEEADNFLVRFSRSVAEAATGTGNLANFLRVNNINAQAFAKLPLDQQLARYGQLLAGASGQQAKLNDLFIVGGRNAGPNLLQALQSLSGGWDETANAASKAGTVIDQEFIQRAEKSAEKWRTLKMQFSVNSEELAVSTWELLARSIGSVASFIDDLIKKLDELRKNSSTGASTGVPFGTVPGIGFVPGMEGSGLPFDFGNPPPARKSVPDVLAPLNNGAADARSGSAPPPPSDGKTKQYNAQADAIEKLIKAQDDRIKLLQAEDQAVGKSVYDTTYLTEKIKLEAEARKLNNNQPLSPAVLASIDEEAKKIAAATQALEDHKRAWAGINSAVQFAGDQAIDAMDGLRQGTLTAADAVRQLENAFIHAAEQALLLGSGPLAGLFGTQSAVQGGTGGLLGMLISGFRAGGGPVQAGRAYVVNENTARSEIFVPGQDGMIYPQAPAPSIIPAQVAGRKGQSGDVNVTINSAPIFQAGMTPTDMAAIEMRLQQNNATLRRQVQTDLRTGVRNDADFLTRGS